MSSILTTEIPSSPIHALSNDTTSSGPASTAADGGDGGGGADVTEEEKIVLFVILGFISLFGTLGNGLVLYVFTRKRDNVTSTIFILALAWTDLFTCMVIVPFTLVNIEVSSALVFDAACKAYQFLITFNVPLAAFIMVAIAVDRYFSICHPFMHAVTPRRARISIMCLCLLAFTLGTITALMHSVYKAEIRLETVARGEASWCPNLTLNDATAMLSVSPPHPASTDRPPIMPMYSHSQDLQIFFNRESFNTTSTDNVSNNSSSNAIIEDTCSRNVSEYVYNGICELNLQYFSFDTIDIYANVQASLYAISLLLVFTLYFFIYRSVVRRRAWRRKQKSWSHSPMTAQPVHTDKQPNTKSTDVANDNQAENMELVVKKQTDENDADKSESAEDSGHGSNNGASKTENGNGNTLKQQLTVENGSSRGSSSQSKPKVLTSAEKKTNRERRDFNFLANIRTAAMLFVVAIVFIFSFVPSWLMAAGILPFNYIVFYMYFTYNSANPVIYAFMNQSFRKELKRVFQRDFPCTKVCCKPRPRVTRDLEESKTINTIYSACESPLDPLNRAPVIEEDVGATEESVDEDDTSSVLEAAIAASSQANV